MDLQTRILIVDDDEGIRSLIGEFLGKHGYDAKTAADPMAMRELLAAEPFDLIVLDVMMPREDGLTALRQLGPDAPPVIMLSAVGNDVDRIVGLEMGADDYLAKPCNPRELLARIRSVLRRRAGAPRQVMAPTEGSPLRIAEIDSGDCLYFSGWRMDLGLRLLFDASNAVISLSDGEFRLLRAFAEHPRRVLTRDQLLDWSRGEDSDHYDRAIDVQLSRLRRKLTEGENGSDIIRTVRNEGYLFVPAVNTTATPG
ncbi:response regulator(with CheY-like receiver domain and winged-helix DNA-binding domain) [Novosphingobium sp. Rr 2-17]|uniref:response regulator n=1 Tax=Novosphingobium sp. Rr 2-17 TaxID=555793 RepID=UPI0002697EC7|nr:response regulator [Novosphingobium sp. Rr 2-17]EIZ79002.1 response regulator(with CheY-like receiver domain and winged-helix DNA-binding domain) [Novosphingobium sp. Rr 2-17]